jgi:broad specificity phosphatase PhoE
MRTVVLGTGCRARPVATTTAPPALTRRRMLRAATTVVALAVLVGCASGTGRTSSAPSRGATTILGTRPDLVMVIRHGEKPDDSHSGVDANGNEDGSSLTEIGWERARRLVDLFDPAQGRPRPGLARPTAIYAAGANDDGEGARTRETVTPLADQLGITVNTSFGKGEEKELVEHALGQAGPTLISWQHGEIPAMAEAFPGATPSPPTEWPDDRYDVIWTFTKTADGWQFAQLPELLLPQDQDSPIQDEE